MKHFLTVERPLDYKGVLEERKYSYDEVNYVVIESTSVYVLDTMELIQENIKTKVVDIETAMINLAEIFKHPNVTFLNTEFMNWFSTAYLDGEFNGKTPVFP